MTSQRRLSAQEISAALGGRPAGEDKWKARCPAHEDKNPSLSIAESPSGKVLLKCWSGCTQDQVIRALRDRRLWPDYEEDRPTPALAAAPIIDPELDALLSKIYWFLLRGQLADSDLRELDRTLADAEIVKPDCGYMIVGQLLEDAAAISYHNLARVSTELRGKGVGVERYVERWMNERYPDALFEPRS